MRACSAMALLPAAGLLAFAQAGCTRGPTRVEEGDRLQVLHAGNLSEPKDLDPHVVTGVTEHNLISALLEGLVAEDPRDLSPVPGAAARWEVSPDGRVYTFHLRPDARWSNGEPLTAGDFVFSYERMLSPAMANPYAYMLFGLTNAQAYGEGRLRNFAQVGATAVDERTLLLTLAEPIPYFLSLLTHYSWYPVHPATLRRFGAEAKGGTAWTRAGHYVGNGPFVLKEWLPDRKIVVARNDAYWDRAAVRLREIHFYPIGDHWTEERAFLAGQLHVTGTVPVDRIAHYRAKQPGLIRVEPYLGTYYYLFNVRRPPLDKAPVRRALAMSIDREKLVRHVTRAGESPAHHFTPPDTAGFRAQARIPFDPPAARRLLAEAGFPGGRGFPRVELLYNTSDAHAKIAQAVQQMWKTELGIDVELVNMEWAAYLARTQDGRYDVARAGWISDYADPNSFLDMWMTGGGNNRTGWSDPRYDQLIRDAARTPDRAARHALFQEAERILAESAPVLPLYFYRSKCLIRPSVRGWHPNLMDHHPYKHVYLQAP